MFVPVLSTGALRFSSLLGIIQKEFQHTGETYQTFYGPNPFHGETEDDLRDYMRGMKVQLPSDINFLKPSILEQKPEPPPVAPKPASVPATPSHVASAASVPQPAATSTPTAAQKQPQQPQPQPPAPAGHTATVEGQTLPTAQKASVGVVLSETTLSTESSGSATTPKASATLSASTLRAHCTFKFYCSVQ